jgi:hypothetical protein
MTKHEEIFSKIYNTSFWGKNKSSGEGSDPKNIKFYTPFLRGFIMFNNIKSIGDLGCGDFACADQLYKDLNIKYTGYDVYLPHIESHNQKYKNDNRFSFRHLDFFENPAEIESAELFLLKDVLQHWSNKEVDMFLDFFIKNINFKYLLLTNTPDLNFIERFKCRLKIDEGIIDLPEKIDIETGEFRTLSAFNTPLNKHNPIILFIWGEKIWLETSLIVKK